MKISITVVRVIRGETIKTPDKNHEDFSSGDVILRSSCPSLTRFSYEDHSFLAPVQFSSVPSFRQILFVAVERRRAEESSSKIFSKSRDDERRRRRRRRTFACTSTSWQMGSKVNNVLGKMHFSCSIFIHGENFNVGEFILKVIRVRF